MCCRIEKITAAPQKRKHGASWSGFVFTCVHLRSYGWGEDVTRPVDSLMGDHLMSLLWLTESLVIPTAKAAE